MPTTIPVPSKGALRTLRHLALGTSCTVALSAGLLTEDRRRRIHAAREVHNNAQKLKSSRKYHSAGTLAIETFEEQAARLEDDAFWLPSNVARSKTLEISDSFADTGMSKANVQTTPRPQNYKDITWKSYRPASFHLPSVPALLKTPKESKQSLHNRQQRLARDVTKLLDEDPPDVLGATSRFLEAFESGLAKDEAELLQRLIDTASRLAAACRHQSRFEDSARIFDVIFGHGPLREEDYHSFQPYEMISRLLERSSFENVLNEANLKKGASIYLAKFKEKPQSMSNSMVSLGEDLCREAYNLGLYELCVDLHFRISQCGEHDSPKTIEYLLKATHARGQHKKMFRYFKNFFAKTTPSATEFYEVINVVVESLLKLGDFEKVEEVLIAAVPLATRTGSSLSTTWFLKVLGQHWRAFHDISGTRALFERLKPPGKHPQALYIAMIQCYVEAGDEPAAATLFDQLQFLYELRPKDLRVYGHFALAKAIRGDWAGVKADLFSMRDCNPEDYDTFNSCFVPILKLYFNSHSIAESEEFVRFYVEECQLKLSGYIMNLMINAYAKAKEMDSLTRWISFATKQGATIDSVTFNSLLNNLYHSWRFSYGEVLDFYHRIRSIDGASFILMDVDTTSILRRLATLDGSNKDVVTDRLNKLKSSSPSVSILDSQNVHSKMAMTFGKGNTAGTLKIYKHAQTRKIPLGPEHLLLAVRASLKIHGEDPSEAKILIQDAQRRGLDASLSIAAIFIHKLTEMVEAGERDQSFIIRNTISTIALFENSNIKIPVSVITHTASVLQRYGHNRAAIDFWNTMSQRLNLPPTSIGIATYTVLCKAYSAILDYHGVRLVIEAIRANNIIPDNRFKGMLKEVQKRIVELLVDKPRNEKAQQFLECILEVRQQVKEMRADAMAAKVDVQWKAIQIIEKAVEEQVLHGRVSNAIDEYPSKLIGAERKFGTEEILASPSKRRHAGDAWLMDVVIDTTVPQRQIGVGAG